MTTKITVRADWMKACGFEPKDTEMEVISVLGKTPKGDLMFKVIRPHDNSEWIVAGWRLKLDSHEPTA